MTTYVRPCDMNAIGHLEKSMNRPSICFVHNITACQHI